MTTSGALAPAPDTCPLTRTVTRVFVDAYLAHGCDDSGSMTTADVRTALPDFARQHDGAALAAALDELVDGGILRCRSLWSDRYELTAGLRARIIARNGPRLWTSDGRTGHVVGEIPRVIAEQLVDFND